MQNRLVKRPYYFIFQYVHVVFPILLPVLAPTIHEEPRPGEDQTYAAKDVSEIFLINQLFGA